MSYLFVILDNLHLINPDTLGFWLCERQLPSGGLNGRPEKLPDVCYSWWVFASLHMIGRSHWINKDALKRFIFACQVSDWIFLQSKPLYKNSHLQFLKGKTKYLLIESSFIK